MGARVCQAWQSVQQSKTCKPKRINLHRIDAEEQSTVFLLPDHAIDNLPTHVTLNILDRHGSYDLVSLCIHEDRLVPPPVLSRLSAFDNLQDLHITSYDGGVLEWDLACKVFPAGLEKLEFDIALSCVHVENVADQNLHAFDRLAKLRCLTLTCEWID